MKNTAVLKDLMISTYEKIGSERAVLIGGKAYSGNEVVEEIRKETAFGIKLMNDVIQLTIDLLRRDKLNIDNLL